MPQPPQRDLELTARRLGEWFRSKLPDARKVDVVDLVKPDGSGYSNDTLLCSIRHDDGGESVREDLVIRVEPAGFPVFPSYDLGKQFEVMKALGEKTDVPVPRVRWREDDAEILGGSFYAMSRVEGRVPADNPPYPTEGFVHDARESERAALWWNGIDALTRVHRVDWRAAGLDFLRWPDADASPIDQHLAEYAAYLEWAAEGRPQPTSEAALAWLRENMPSDEPVGLCWGDARVGNIIFRGFEVAAVIDWEMVTLGNPETDLGWWLFVDRVTMEGNGIPGMARPRLAGLPSHEETVARYERITGRTVEHLRYYEVFAGLRFACVMIRIMQQQAHYGTFPVEAAKVLERNNVVTHQLASLLGLPAPE